MTHSAVDFALAGRSLSALAVAWVILGTLVGGASTIGTVQMAYGHGMPAWYFTLASGVACALLALFFAAPLRRSGCTTISEFLGESFGARFRAFSSIIVSGGMFLHIVAQLIAAAAIVQVILRVGEHTALALAFVLVSLLLVSGGMRTAAWIGKVKCVLLYTIMLSCAAWALDQAGGMASVVSKLPDPGRALSLFGCDVTPGLIDIFSVVIGVLSTQIYLQAIFAAKDVQAARRGCMICAVLTPPIGLLGIVVGLHLQGSAPALVDQSATALPWFIEQTFPTIIASIFHAGLLFAVLGTASGLALGVTTTVSLDLIPSTWKSKSALGLRVVGLMVLALASALVYVGWESTILQWSYLSMGLRGSAVLLGLCLALIWQGDEHRSKLTRFTPLLFAPPFVYILLKSW